MNKLSAIDWVVYSLVVIGALNWGLIGFFKFDLVAFVLGNMTFLSRVVYSLVGLSALWVIYILMRLAGK